MALANNVKATTPFLIKSGKVLNLSTNLLNQLTPFLIGGINSVPTLIPNDSNEPLSCSTEPRRLSHHI